MNNISNIVVYNDGELELKISVNEVLYKLEKIEKNLNNIKNYWPNLDYEILNPLIDYQDKSIIKFYDSESCVNSPIPSHYLWNSDFEKEYQNERINYRINKFKEFIQNNEDQINTFCSNIEDYRDQIQKLQNIEGMDNIVKDLNTRIENLEKNIKNAKSRILEYNEDIEKLKNIK